MTNCAPPVSRQGGTRLFSQMIALKRLVMVLGCAVLAVGCSSVGVRYVSADDVPDAAEIVDGGATYINSVNDKGCYSGRTELGKSFKLRPGQQVVLTQEAEFVSGVFGPRMFCRVIVAFTPQASKRYAVRRNIVTLKDAGKNLFGNSVDRQACVLNVLELVKDGSLTAVPTEPRLLSGLGCIRFVDPKAEETEETEKES